MGDASLSALLATQCLTTFVAIPVAAAHPAGRWMLDLSHLLFAAVCAFALTRRRAVQSMLIGALLLFAAGPVFLRDLGSRLGLGPEAPHVMITAVAFGFNALVTVLVARRTFGPGRVTAHRVQGAVLVYLNVAALCAIMYDVLEMHAPGSIRSIPAGMIGMTAGARTAELSYFSLSTITTAGYGDLVPVGPLARGLANLEAVFGQLFPATFLARLVALHLAQAPSPERRDPDVPPAGPAD
jgi:hypothetical protein